MEDSYNEFVAENLYKTIKKVKRKEARVRLIVNHLNEAHTRGYERAQQAMRDAIGAEEKVK